jgi:hypothetical protein
MAFDADQRRAALRLFMANENVKIGPWEQEARLGDGTLRKFMNGTTNTLTDQTYSRLADAASRMRGRSIDVQELQSGFSITSGNLRPGATTDMQSVQKRTDAMLPALIMWRVALGETGQQGAFLLSSEPAGEIVRPDRVAGSKTAFSCKLLDNANAPGYRAGHTVVADPDTGPTIGDLCIFTSDPAIPGGAPSFAAIFAGHTAEYWLITQATIPGEQHLSRKVYPHAWPVVVHYPHGP